MAADRVRPAVVVLATFDEHGRAIANQHGFFISGEGDIVADETAMNNAVSAMVKGADGHAYDTLGTYIRSESPHFIVLKTNARHVPSLEDSPTATTVPDGAAAAIVLSANDNTRAPLLEGQITGHKNDGSGEWLTFEPAPPKTAIGAPVVDATGAIIGIVAQRSESSAPSIFRYGGAASASTADAVPEESSGKEQSIPPAEGPAGTPWTQGTVAKGAPRPIANLYRFAEIDTSRLQPEKPAPFSTPKGFFIRMNPNWHIHARDRPPSPSAANATNPSHTAKLVYTPAPRYSMKSGADPRIGASGNYRLKFDAEGKVVDVQVRQSAGERSLDDAAIASLRSWRSEPGEEWSVVVPVMFKQ